MKVDFGKFPGFGESWYVLFVDNQFQDTAHEDDKQGMERLRAKKEEAENKV